MTARNDPVSRRAAHSSSAPLVQATSVTGVWPRRARPCPHEGAQLLSIEQRAAALVALFDTFGRCHVMDVGRWCMPTQHVGQVGQINEATMRRSPAGRSVRPEYRSDRGDRFAAEREQFPTRRIRFAGVRASQCLWGPVPSRRPCYGTWRGIVWFPERASPLAKAMEARASSVFRHGPGAKHRTPGAAFHRSVYCRARAQNRDRQVNRASMPAPMGAAPLNCVKASSNWQPCTTVLSNSWSGGAWEQRGPS